MPTTRSLPQATMRSCSWIRRTFRMACHTAVSSSAMYWWAATLSSTSSTILAQRPSATSSPKDTTAHTSCTLTRPLSRGQTLRLPSNQVETGMRSRFPQCHALCSQSFAKILHNRPTSPSLAESHSTRPLGACVRWESAVRSAQSRRCRRNTMQVFAKLALCRTSKQHITRGVPT